MLGTAEADALRSILHCICRISRGVRVGAHLQSAVLVRPLHNPPEVSADGSFHSLNVSFINLTGGAVQGNIITLVEHLAAKFKYFVLLVDGNFTTARYAGRAHTASHNSRVRGHAAAHGQNAFRRMHALDILRRGLQTYQYHSLALLMGILRLVRGKVYLTCRCAGRRGKRLSDYLACLQSVGIKGRM